MGPYFFKNLFSWLAKRVVSWSSLDWDRSRWAQIDLVLGTLFDVAIHALNSVLLFPFVDSMEGFLFAIVMNIILAYVFIFNPKFAWSNPEEVPKWVQSRIKPLSADQRQEIKTLEKLGQMFWSFKNKSSLGCPKWILWKSVKNLFLFQIMINLHIFSYHENDEGKWLALKTNAFIYLEHPVQVHFINYEHKLRINSVEYWTIENHKIFTFAWKIYTTYLFYS